MKLLVAEPGADTAEAAWVAADSAVAVRLLYPEARAALASAVRGGRLPERLYEGRRTALEGLWEQLDVVELTEEVARAAGDMAANHGLRGYDAVHLSAVLRVGADVLVSADEALLKAAPLHGLDVVDCRSDPPPRRLDI